VAIQKIDPSTEALIADAVAALLPIATLPEVAKVARFSVRHLRRFVDQGRLKTLRATESGSSRVLVPRNAVGDLLRSLVRP
jgi:hypothetical protein